MWMKIGFMILAALVFSTSAIAQKSLSLCMDRDVIVERLSGHFGEVRQFIGLTAGGTMVEVWASVSTGTWTITATQEIGMTCFISAGKLFKMRNDDQNTGIPILLERKTP